MRRLKDRGSATVEFAMVLPAITLLLGVLGMAARYGIALVQTQDAASVSARVAIVGSDDEARSAGLAIVGGDASVTVTREGQWVRVVVVNPEPWGLEVRATAVTRAQD